MESHSVIDDYGLTLVRVSVTPVLSGVAAVAGVFLIALLSINLLKSPEPSSVPVTPTVVSTQVVTPAASTPVATPRATSTPSAPPVPPAGSQSSPSTSGSLSLADIYNLDNNFQGIIIAAIFGLTPNLLIGALQQKTEEFKTRLESSKANA
jgi:hypothetical protein